jgi:nitrite reductase/ring-hydroxylating ferredoxin subunit
VIVTPGGKLSVGVYNVSGTLVAVRNVCPHAGAPVCRGVVTGAVVSDARHRRRWSHQGEILRCPWHGWEFKLPEAVTLTNPPVRLKTYPVVEREGKIIVELGDRASHAGASEKAADA